MPQRELEQSVSPKTNSADWSYTVNAEEIRRLRDEMESSGKNRHSIARDTSVLEGISEGRYGGEAIVVDYKDSPESYDAALDEVIARSETEGRIDKSLILDSVFEVVSEKMDYSLEAVDAIFKHELGGIDNKKVGLSVYLDEGKGVCRHQALFAAALLELLKNKGIVGGTASVDRNINWSQEGEPGGHAWTRYTNSAGEVYILDVAQKFIGSLEEAVGRKETTGHGWDYARPEEKETLRNRVLGRNATTGLIDRIPDWVNGR